MADSIDARRFRRTRLKRAMQPIIAMLGCTQMGAADAIKGVFNENHRLIAKVNDLGKEIESLKSDLDEKESEIQYLKLDIAGRDEKIVERDAEIDRLKTAIDTRIDTEARQDEKIEALEENLNVTTNELAVLKESKSIQEG